jgi:hypothetical protein
MKVRYRNRVLDYPDKLPTREAILKELGLSPLAVLFVDAATGQLLPPGKALTPDLEIEVRAVISGG